MADPLSDLLTSARKARAAPSTSAPPTAVASAPPVAAATSPLDALVATARREHSSPLDSLVRNAREAHVARAIGPRGAEIATDAKKQPRRPNPLRTISDDLEVPLSLVHSYLRGDENNTNPFAPGDLGKAIDLIRKGKIEELNNEYGAGSEGELRYGVAHGDPIAAARAKNPYLNAGLTIGEEFYNPSNLLAGPVIGGLGKAARLARAVPQVNRAVTAAGQAAKPVTNAVAAVARPAATKAGKIIAPVVAPIRRASAAANAAADVVGRPINRAFDAVERTTTGPLSRVAQKVGGKAVNATLAGAEKVPGLKPTAAAARGLFSRYAGLRARGGDPYVHAGIAAQTAPDLARDKVVQNAQARFGGLTRAQKIEVQRLSYKDADGNPLATRDPAVPEPKRGPSLQARADGVRDDLRRDDFLLNELGIRDQQKGELYNGGTFFPMAEYDEKHPVYAHDDTEPELAPGQEPTSTISGVAIRRRGSGRKATVTKGGRKVKDTILGSEDELHPDYDPAVQYQEHRAMNARAIANEQSNRAFENVPLIDQTTGLQKTYEVPGLSDLQPINARLPIQYALKRDGNSIYLGAGEEGHARRATYIDAAARAKANQEARQDPSIQAMAASYGVDPAELGTRRLVARDMRPYDARLAAQGQGQLRIAKTAARATQDVERNAARRAQNLARVVGKLDRTKRDLVLGNDALGAALRENSTLREALNSGVESQRAAANAILDELGQMRQAARAQRPGNVRAVASGMADEQSAAQKPYWDALAQVGGKITPDLVWDPALKRYRLAGEFAALPRRLLAPLRSLPTSFTAQRIPGNIDQVAAIVRNTDPAATEDDVRAFFAQNTRPPRAGDFTDDATERILADVLPKYRNAGPEQIDALKRDLDAARAASRTTAAEARGAARATGSLAKAAAKMRTAVGRATGASGGIEAAADALRAQGAQTGGEVAALQRIGALSDREAARLSADRSKVEEIRGRGEVAKAFRRAQERYYRDLYDTVKQSIVDRTEFVPGKPGEFVRDAESPSAKGMAIDKQLVDFFQSQQRLSPAEQEDAKRVWRTFQTLNRLTRASIVLFPQVHAINNLGMHFLAEGGSPFKMSEILAGQAQFEPALVERAEKAGLPLGNAARTFGGGSDAHALTTDAGELANEFGKKVGAKIGPLGKIAAGAARAGIEADRRVYQPMNQWLFNNVERGYALDRFDAFTKAGMSDGEAAVRVRNAFGKYGDLSPREVQANLDRIFYFYPWMKTVVPFWTQKGMLAPQWWNAPVRAIKNNNEQQGYDDPSRPFTGTFGKRADGDFRRIVLPVPQRALESVAAFARTPFDVGDLDQMRQDAVAPINYLTGRASLPASIALDALAAAGQRGTGALPQSNIFYSKPGETTPQRLGTIAGNAAQRVVGPLETISRFAADPAATIAESAAGAFGYGTSPKAKAAGEHRIRAQFGAIIARVKGNPEAVARLEAEREAAVARFDAQYAARK